MNVGESTNLPARGGESEEKISLSPSSSVYARMTSEMTIMPSNDRILDENKKRQDGEVYTVLIKKQPPFHLFPKQEFEIDYVIAPSDGTSDVIPSRHTNDLLDLKIVAELMQSDDDISKRLLYNSLPAESARLIILEHKQSESAKGTILCRIDSVDQFNNTSIEERRDNKFLIRLSASRLMRSGGSVRAELSRTFSLAPFRMVVSTNNGWENVWYKDEGGSGKCIEVNVCAKDKDDQMLRKKIELSLILCTEESDTTTEEPKPVENQEKTLTIKCRSSNLHIDPDTGKATVRFRVEKVSANHQSKNFILKIAAHGNWNISPGFAPPVTVMSKRTKKPKNPSFASGGDGRSLVDSSPSTHYPMHDLSESRKSSPVFFEGYDPSTLQRAYNGVAQWAKDVVECMYPLQWQIVGFAQFPDGTPDYNRPHHNMMNPNPTITRLLKGYEDATSTQLRVLGDAIKHHSRTTRTTSASPQHDTYERSIATYGMYNASMMRGQSSLVPPGTDLHHGQPYQYHTQSMISPRPHVPIRNDTLPPSQPFLSRDIRDVIYPHLESSPHAFQNAGNQYAQSIQFARAALHSPVPSRDGRIEASNRQRLPISDYPSVRQDNPLKRMKYTSPGPKQNVDVSPVREVAAVHMPSNSYTSSRESEVEYVLAKPQRSKRSEEGLGFPAYSIRKELLGFYRSISLASPAVQALPRFLPIAQLPLDFSHKDEFIEATAILDDAIMNESEAVHRVNDFASIDHMLDSCTVYEYKLQCEPSLSGRGKM